MRGKRRGLQNNMEDVTLCMMDHPSFGHIWVLHICMGRPNVLYVLYVCYLPLMPLSKVNMLFILKTNRHNKLYKTSVSVV